MFHFTRVNLLRKAAGGDCGGLRYQYNVCDSLRQPTYSGRNELCNTAADALLLKNIQQFSCYNRGLLGSPPSITATSSPPPLCLIWPPLLACHITMATGTRERHGGGKKREGERWRGLTHLLILPCTWKWAPQLGILEKACIPVYLECV